MDTIDKVYYINLDDRKERMTKFEGKYRPIFGDKLTRISAVNGRTYRYSLNEIALMRKANWDICRKPGVQGCFLSHMYIYQTMVRQNVKLAIVLEDDAMLLDNVSVESDLKDVLDHAPKNFEVIFIGYEKTDVLKPVNEKIGIVNKNPYSHAYLITLEGARNLLQAFMTQGMSHAIDYFLTLNLRSKNILYGSRKIMFIQDPGFQSDIQ
jgi:glycosyl transferase, family 25